LTERKDEPPRDDTVSLEGLPLFSEREDTELSVEEAVEVHREAQNDVNKLRNRIQEKKDIIHE
jgi:hypothetical protein